MARPSAPDATPIGSTGRPVLVVAGNGMVGHRFVEAAVERGLHRSHEIVVLGEERRPAYDRVHLSSVLDGSGQPRSFAWATPTSTMPTTCELLLGERAEVLDTAARTVTTTSRATSPTTTCVLATGRAPFVPPMPGTDAGRRVRLPHARRPRRHPGVGRRVRAGRRRRRRAARPRGGQRAAACSGVQTTVVEFAAG